MKISPKSQQNFRSYDILHIHVALILIENFKKPNCDNFGGPPCTIMNFRTFWKIYTIEVFFYKFFYGNAHWSKKNLYENVFKNCWGHNTIALTFGKKCIAQCDEGCTFALLTYLRQVTRSLLTIVSAAEFSIKRIVLKTIGIERRIKITVACRDQKINHEKQTKGSIFKSRHHTREALRRGCHIWYRIILGQKQIEYLEIENILGFEHRFILNKSVLTWY